MKRLTLLLALLLVPSQALAECAWVLWLRNVQQLDHVVKAFASREECVLEQERSLNMFARAEGVKWVGDVVSWLQKTKDGKEQLQRVRYTCLPDTVDPRGRKGT